ncbi:MAG: hypothetical protein M1819_006617 [Sarea resinae]|nr:MAG: hypothetical protein M1819_006617 [Sarea resinae]
MWSPVYLLLLFCLGLVHALSSTGNRLLVVIEELAEKERYSKFWNDLEARGYQVSFESPKNDKLSLFQHGERAFDHLLLLPPKSKGFGPALTPNILLDFINKEGNILLTLSATHPTPSSVNSLLLELDIHLPPDRNSLVVDHFHYDALSATEKHDVLLLPPPQELKPGVKNYFALDDEKDKVIAFPRGVGQTLGNASPLLAPVLRGSNTAYSYNPKDEPEATEEPFAVGSQLSLVSTLEARNSARLTVLGSAEMLQNKWFGATVKGPEKGGKETKTANQAFARRISAWTFQELGVLKVGRVEHHLSAGDQQSGSNDSVALLGELNPKIYRIKNDVTFTIELSEYINDHYAPFLLPSPDDLQLEFTMLSPYHRLNLHPSLTTFNSTLFTTSFTIPDQHGIFKFRVNYKRPFLTYLDVKEEVTVRHFAHDEWPRSWRISGAWVWIAGIGVTVVGWCGFVALWLWCEPVRETGKGKKTQ